MREEVLKFLNCPACNSHELVLTKTESDELEVRSGSLVCPRCRAVYNIKDGIIDFLNYGDEGVMRERKAMDDDEYIKDESGTKFRINAQTIEKFRDKFLAFPEGDGSYLFKRGGSFQSTAEAADRFYAAMEELHLTGKEKILEIGACFSYASSKFAKSGCSVVATDISNYLRVADVFIRQAYFERIFSDMHHIPFGDNTFDIVFGSAILHHSKRLKQVFGEIYRVLKPGGRLVLINEAGRGVLEKVHPVYIEQQAKGFGDTPYTIPQFKRAAKEGGFRKVKVVFLSLAADYLTRHKNRDSKINYKIRIAYFFKKHKILEGFILRLSAIPRILFRPKSWKMVCYKNAKN